MSIPFAPHVGGVSSADIAVPEQQRELRFYSRVLGTGQNPLWRDDLTNNLGVPIIGLGSRTTEHADLPLQWMPHIRVADVATSAARALSLGGGELMHGRGADGKSQWAVLLDPNGAAFGIVPVVEAGSPSQPDGPGAPMGRIAWVDLTVPNASATRDFYSEVIGWSAQDVAMKDASDSYADYNMLGGDGEPAAGVCHARGTNAGLPSVWMIYLPVGDLDESVRRVEEEGGTVLRTMRNGDGMAMYAAVRDPVGAFFALVPA